MGSTTSSFQRKYRLNEFGYDDAWAERILLFADGVAPPVAVDNPLASTLHAELNRREMAVGITNRSQTMTIPTEPIGSIPRPLQLIRAVAASGGGSDPKLNSLHEEAIKDTIERFEATGSPVIFGVVAPIDSRIEDPASIRDRILEAADYIPIEQLGTTDDRGFSPFSNDTSSNAIKFTAREGTIRVSARQRDYQIVVSVADTGPDIPQEHLVKIFDRFWRTPGTNQKGSGLGLSIAKGIVEAHGGTIWAESQMGKAVHFSSLCLWMMSRISAMQRCGLERQLGLA
jgi:hypothetical protein